MYKKAYILILFVLLQNVAKSEIITLKGNVKDYSGAEVDVKYLTVELVQEFVTKRRIVVTEGVLDAHGNFEVQFNLDQTELIFLDFGKVERSLFCVPGKTYFIEVRGPFKDLSLNHGLLAKDVNKANIVNATEKELNYNLEKLNTHCTNFLAQNWSGRKSYKSMDSFIDSLKTSFSNIQNEYFQNYLSFKEAELMMYFYRTKRKVFVEKYLEGKKGFALNYMSHRVVYSFFKGVFKNEWMTYHEMEVVNMILDKDVRALMDLIYPNENPEDTELQELVLLLGIHEIRFMPEFKKSQLTNFLEAFIQQSQFKHHQAIAQNIISQIKHLQVGSEAPKLSVRTKDDRFDLLKDRKEYVYLCFFKAWDETILQEIKIMNYLQRRFEEELKVVCVSTDIDTNYLNTLQSSLDQDRMNISIFHYAYDADILLDYRIEDYRLDRYDENKIQRYYLIAPNGKIVLSPAKRPSKGFEYQFKNIISNL